MPKIITDTRGLAPGSVLYFQTYVDPQDGREPWWWKHFRGVLRVESNRFAETLVLRMDINPDKDVRNTDFALPKEQQVIQTIDHVPQGVAAMLMKHITSGEFDTSGKGWAPKVRAPKPSIWDEDLDDDVPF